MKKRGLSAIVVTLILIVLSLVAVGIFWVVIKNILNDSSKNVGVAYTSLTLSLDLMKVYEENGNLHAEVKRNVGAGELKKIQFIIYTANDFETITKDSSLKELESQDFTIELSKLNISELTKVVIVPIFESGGGSESVGDIADVYNINYINNTLEEEPENITEPEIPCVPDCGTRRLCGPAPNGCNGTNACGTCSAGFMCSNGKCVYLSCSDETFYGECSTTKPKYCNGGTLIDNPTICGCPTGLKFVGGQCLDIVTVVLANEQVVTSFNFESEVTSWTKDAWKLSEAVFTWENTGHTGSRSISINSPTANDASWKHTINLNPQKIYRLVGYVKGENIVNREGGTIGAHFNILTWENTPDKTGTFGWTKVTSMFQGASGTTEMMCRLGSWSNTVTGKAWFDDIVLTSDPLTKYEGENIYLMLEPTDLTSISTSSMKQWVINLDKAYNSYYELVGSKPFSGSKIGVLSVTQSPGGWAVSGNPIKWHQVAVAGELSRVNNGDWSFGILHEIGHDFSSCNWNCDWSGEFWANFKMYYVIETLNGTVNHGKDYVGSALKTYYKTDSGESYDNSFAKGFFRYDGLVYKFVDIKDKIGWGPFKQTFRYFSGLSSAPATKLDKLNLFISKLSEYSGQNVRNMFTTAEWNIMMTEFS